ncbi:MAG: ArsR family transcriptional regulator [Kiritimatiellia bacterium]
MRRNDDLRPTLWRTVRAVLNEQRLRLLRDVFAHDGEFYVRQVAKRAGLDDPIASIYLRQMNARGLLGVRRDHVRVYYNTMPDRSLPEAVAFQAALRASLAGRLAKGWELRLMTVLRGFSHFNRLTILRRLAESPANHVQLSRAAGICAKSVYHHLRYLRCARLVDATTRDGEDVFALVRPENPVAACLLRILLADKFAETVYSNPGSERRMDRAEKAFPRRRDTRGRDADGR